MLTDGESRPFAEGEVARALRAARIDLVTVHVGDDDERVFRDAGIAERLYRPDPRADDALAALAAATAARPWRRTTPPAPAARRAALGDGPTRSRRRRAPSRPARALARAPRARAASLALEPRFPRKGLARFQQGVYDRPVDEAAVRVPPRRGRRGASPSRSARPARLRPSGGDWLAFGRTADQNRYSPLTQITPGNVDNLGRVFKVDFRQLDATVRRGEQSYPLAINGVLYLTTNDNSVWAINGTTGARALALRPEQARALLELRHRREPRARLLRRAAVPAHPRHAHRRAEPAQRQRDPRGADRRRGAGRVDQLRLLGDERADVREQPGRDRRRRARSSASAAS